MEARHFIVAGISHLETGRWADAIACFDQAIELREAEPWQRDPQAAWALSAAHLNRGDALRQSGRLHDALPAYDRAIAAMAHVPLDADPAHPDRLALAWINRATTRAQTSDMDGGLDDFSQAAGLLDSLKIGNSPRRNFLRVMLHSNRACLMLDLRKPTEALPETRAAMATLREIPTSPEIIDAAITARAIHCRALAELLGDPAVTALEPDWIASATDAAEEALSLASRFRLHPSHADLVRYAARIYRICQPHFLAEFIREVLAPGTRLSGEVELIRDMSREILHAKIALELRVRQNPHNTPAVERELRILTTLQQVERELAGVSRKSAPLCRPKSPSHAS